MIAKRLAKLIFGRLPRPVAERLFRNAIPTPEDNWARRVLSEPSPFLDVFGKNLPFDHPGFFELALYVPRDPKTKRPMSVLVCVHKDPASLNLKQGHIFQEVQVYDTPVLIVDVRHLKSSLEQMKKHIFDVDVLRFISEGRYFAGNKALDLELKATAADLMANAVIGLSDDLVLERHENFKADLQKLIEEHDTNVLLKPIRDPDAKYEGPNCTHFVWRLADFYEQACRDENGDQQIRFDAERERIGRITTELLHSLPNETSEKKAIDSARSVFAEVTGSLRMIRGLLLTTETKNVVMEKLVP